MKKVSFTLVEIMIVVAILGILAAIAVPNFMKSRQRSAMNACIENMWKIESAKQLFYAISEGELKSAQDLVDSGGILHRVPQCPSDNSDYENILEKDILVVCGYGTINTLGIDLEHRLNK